MKTSALTWILAVTGMAMAGGDSVVFDQITDAGGADLDGGLSATQYFNATFVAYDIAALDDFTGVAWQANPNGGFGFPDGLQETANNYGYRLTGIPVAGGGCEGGGDCFEAHRTPGCDDAACCNAVCELEPFCCAVAWDDICVSLAEGLDVCVVGELTDIVTAVIISLTEIIEESEAVLTDIEIAQLLMADVEEGIVQAIARYELAGEFAKECGECGADAQAALGPIFDNLSSAFVQFLQAAVQYVRASLQHARGLEQFERSLDRAIEALDQLFEDPPDLERFDEKMQEAMDQIGRAIEQEERSQEQFKRAKEKFDRMLSKLARVIDQIVAVEEILLSCGACADAALAEIGRASEIVAAVTEDTEGATQITDDIIVSQEDIIAELENVLTLLANAIALLSDCPWDLDASGDVGTNDLILLLGSWGDPYGTADLIRLLGAWGPCP